MAVARLHKSMMPEGERGYIGHIKPSGWHTVKYPDLIKDRYLYNRCHLIAFALTGQTSNEKNLITGTRHLNAELMLPYEMQVILRKKDESAKELVWVRVEGTTEMFFFGKLLNEPLADYGYHLGDMVCFRIVDEEGTPTAYLDERSYLNDYERIFEDEVDSEDMTDEESDEIIEQMLYGYAVKQYYEDKTDEKYEQMVDYLLSHKVYVPFLAEFSKEDMERIEKIVEDEDADIDMLRDALDFVDRENISLKPDILERDESVSLFPCFTSEEEMEKYEDHYARIPVEFPDAIELALNYPEKRLDGIVVNAFTTPVELGVEQLRKISRSWR